MGIKVSYRQGGKLFKKLFSHGVHYFLGYMYHQHCHHVGKHACHKVAPQHFYNVFADGGEIHSALADHSVHRASREHRSHQRKLVGNECQNDCRQKHKLVLKHVFRKSADNVHSGFLIQLFVLLDVFKLCTPQLICKASTQRNPLPSAIRLSPCTPSSSLKAPHECQCRLFCRRISAVCSRSF